jgi:hypothetical protein
MVTQDHKDTQTAGSSDPRTGDTRRRTGRQCRLRGSGSALSPERGPSGSLGTSPSAGRTIREGRHFTLERPLLGHSVGFL